MRKKEMEVLTKLKNIVILDCDADTLYKKVCVHVCVLVTMFALFILNVLYFIFILSVYNFLIYKSCFCNFQILLLR